MKYEMIFGDERLFDGAPEDAVLVSACGEKQKLYFFEGQCYQPCNFLARENYVLSLAMRRIIKEPKRWTVADMQAGRLPEVGSKAMQVQGFCVVDVLIAHHGYVVVCNSEIDDARPTTFETNRFLELFKPIETPEEKAARLREEWVSKATFMTTYEIYDDLLSGDLPVPVKDAK